MQIIYWMKQLMADDYGQILVWLIFILLLMGVDVITLRNCLEKGMMKND